MENKKTTEELYRDLVAIEAEIAMELRESCGDLLDAIEAEELEYVDIKVSELPDIYEAEEEAERDFEAECLSEYLYN